MNHPADQTGQPHHPACAGGPDGGNHSAAMFICEDTDQNGLLAAYNTVRNNQFKGYLGILLVGANAQAAYLVPRFNVLTNNVVDGSVVGCADDFTTGQWVDGDNLWTNNTCAGRGNSPPTYF